MIKQFVCFACVGAFSAMIYFISFVFLSSAAIFDVELSLMIAYTLSVLTHFSGNQFLTFAGSSGLLRQQIPRYLVVLSLNYFITWLVFIMVFEGLNLSPYLAICLSIGLTMLSGFYFSRNWIFR